MFTPLTEKTMFRLNQSAGVRKLMDTEDSILAREQEQERLRELEEQYKASLRIKSGKLVHEWTTVNAGTKLERHEPTGRLMLNGEALADGSLISITHAGEPVTCAVRYITRGPEREIVRAVGDAEGKEPITLAQGMKARIADPEPEPEHEGWYVRYRGGLWQAVRGDFVAGSFPEAADAADLCSVLDSFERTKAQDNSIHYRSVR